MSFTLVAARLLLVASTSVAHKTANVVERQQDERSAIAGTWQLNEEKSEKYDPNRERLLNRSGDITGALGATGQRNRRGSSGGNPRRGGGTSGGGDDAGPAPTGGSDPSRGGRGDMASARFMRLATQQPKTLQIEQTDSTVTIHGGGRPLMLRTNGEEVAEGESNEGEGGGMGGEATTVRATWKKDQLVVEQHAGKDVWVRQTFRVDKKNPKMLIVDVHFESNKMNRVVDNRRVYEMGN